MFCMKYAGNAQDSLRDIKFESEKDTQLELSVKPVPVKSSVATGCAFYDVFQGSDIPVKMSVAFPPVPTIEITFSNRFPYFPTNNKRPVQFIRTGRL